MKHVRSLALSLVVGTLASVVACAEGQPTPDLSGGAEPTKTKEPTEPESPSVTVPDEGSSSGGSSTSSSSGSSTSSSSSGGSSSGGSTSSSGGSTSSTSSSGGSTSSSSSGGSSSGGTDAGADAGSCVKTPPSNVCGHVAQCGCAGNETCDITNKTTGAVSCVLAGGGPLGSLCTTTTQCSKGLTCAYGACRPYCETANAACTGAGLGMCGQYYDPPGTPVPNSKVCTITCDLRNPSAVCGSNTCIWDGGVNATDCDKAGTKNLYDACTSYNDCKQGLACVAHPLFGYECEKWCRVGTNSDCGLFESCVDVYGASAPMQGATKLGHCQ